MYENVTRFWPPMAWILIVQPSQAQPIQATTAWGLRWRRVTSYRRYKYDDDLSERSPVIDDTSTMTTWVKSCQLSTIRVQWRPEWRVSSYWRYEYIDALSEGLPVIDDTSTMTTWVKSCQLSRIRVQWRSEQRVASYRRYKYNDDLTEGLPVINNTKLVQWRPEWRVASR